MNIKSYIFRYSVKDVIIHINYIFRTGATVFLLQKNSIIINLPFISKEYVTFIHSFNKTDTCIYKCNSSETYSDIKLSRILSFHIMFISIQPERKKVSELWKYLTIQYNRFIWKSLHRHNQSYPSLVPQVCYE